MQIKDIKIGDQLYYVGEYPGMTGLYGQMGAIEKVDESINQIVMLLKTSSALHFTAFHLSPRDVSLQKPASMGELHAGMIRLGQEVIDQHNKIELLEAQAVERSRQLDSTKSLADARLGEIESLGAKLTQANNQILRHETSLRALRSANESLAFEKDQMAVKLAEMQHDRQNIQTLYNKSLEKRNEMQGQMDQRAQMAQAQEESLQTVRASNEVLRGTNETLIEKNANLERGLTAANAALEAAQRSNDHNESIIVSLRSQIESLQSIQASQKMLIDGHDPLVKRLQADLHHALHKRSQFEQNAVYWRGVADKMGYNDPDISAHKLAPYTGQSLWGTTLDELGNPVTMEQRVQRIEDFLGRQFESFN